MARMFDLVVAFKGRINNCLFTLREGHFGNDVARTSQFTEVTEYRCAASNIDWMDERLLHKNNFLFFISVMSKFLTFPQCSEL